MMLWIFLVFPALVSSQTQAQFPCYSERSCVVSSSIGSVDSVMDCCLIRRGASVRNQVADEGCSQCAVYGWKGELEVEVMGSEIVTLTIGYSTGQPPRTKQFTLEFDKNTLLVEPSSLTLGVSDVNVTAQVIRDDVMSLQRFDITLVELNPNVVRGQFLLSTLQIVIAAQEVPPSAISLEVSLTESQHTVMESASSLVVCVRAVNSLSRSTPSNLTQSVTVSISDTPGSAERSSDYSIQMNAITFTEVPSTKCASIVIGQDSLYENTETFMLSLTAPSNVTVNQSTATVSILDSDTVIILLLPPQPSSTVNENIGNVIVPYRVMGGISPGITLEFSVLTMDGTAKATTDYIQVNSFINVTTGTINGTISVTITNDAIFETTETFNLVATTMQERVVIENGMVDIVIVDDDGVVNVQAPPLNIIEGAAGELCLSSTTDERAGITVDITVNDTNAAEGIDYTLSQKRVTLSMTGSSQCITINTSTDNLVEGSETFAISLSATEPSVRFEPGNTFPVTIEDVPPSAISLEVSLTESQHTVMESASSLVVCVRAVNSLSRSTPSNLTQSVTVSISDTPGSAKRSSDYYIQMNAITFTEIPSTKCASIVIGQDYLYENTETFMLSLTAPSNVTVNQSTATVSILDSDTIRILLFPLQPTSAVNENVGYIVVLYLVSSQVSRGVTVEFSALTMDGTAKATTDYIQVNSSIDVTFGTINGTILVIIANDAIFETTETFQLVATTMQERVVIENGMVDIVIVDDDGVVNVQAPPLSIIEGEAGELCLSSTTDERASITVDVSVNDTNAAEGIDYTLSQKRVTLSMNGSSQCININANTDNLVEGSETFTISLSATEPSVRFEPGNTFPVTIEDGVTIGFTSTYYAVVGAVNKVVLNVSVLEGAISQSIILSVSTREITPKPMRSYIPLINTMVTIHPNKTAAEVLITVKNGVGWEVFIASLSLLSPLSDRIIVEPYLVPVYIIRYG